MDLEEVKEHFKNAKEVRCLFDGKHYFVDINNLGWDYYKYDSCTDDAWFKGCKVWDEHEGFAEIISYKKDAQRIQEDCELLDNFYRSLPAYYVDMTRKIEQFKKDNGLIIEPTELDKLEQSYAELMEKVEEVKQQIDKLK